MCLRSITEDPDVLVNVCHKCNSYNLNLNVLCYTHQCTSHSAHYFVFSTQLTQQTIAEVKFLINYNFFYHKKGTFLHQRI